MTRSTPASEKPNQAAPSIEACRHNKPPTGWVILVCVFGILGTLISSMMIGSIQDTGLGRYAGLPLRSKTDFELYMLGQKIEHYKTQNGYTPQLEILLQILDNPELLTDEFKIVQIRRESILQQSLKNPSAIFTLLVTLFALACIACIPLQCSSSHPIYIKAVLLGISLSLLIFIIYLLLNCQIIIQDPSIQEKWRGTSSPYHNGLSYHYITDGDRWAVLSVGFDSKLNATTDTILDEIEKLPKQSKGYSELNFIHTAYSDMLRHGDIIRSHRGLLPPPPSPER